MVFIKDDLYTYHTFVYLTTERQLKQATTSSTMCTIEL